MFYDYEGFTLALAGRGTDYLKAEYYSFGVNGTGDLNNLKALPDNIPLALHFDENSYNVSQLSRDLVQQMGGIEFPRRGLPYETWVIGSRQNSFRFHFSDYGITSLGLNEGISNKEATVFDQISISWDESAPITVPISEEKAIEIFGKPHRSRTYRSFGP